LQIAPLFVIGLAQELVQVNLSLEPPLASVTESGTLPVESKFAICAIVVDVVSLLLLLG
jgi:hypothetical protein